MAKNSKLHKEKIEEISTENCEYFKIIDDMYKEIECQLEYHKLDGFLSFEDFCEVHNFLRKSGAPVMNLNSISGNFLNFKLHGKYRTMFDKLNNGKLTSELLYSKYILITNSMWYYLSTTDYPKNLRNYNDTIQNDVIKNISEIINFILDIKVEKEDLKLLENEIKSFCSVVEKMPIRFCHGNLTLDNVFSYHDQFMLINYDKSFVGPFCYDFVVLITDMCHRFGDDYEMVFVKDFFEISTKFFKENIDIDDFFISYKVVQLFYLIEETKKIIKKDITDKESVKNELKTEMSNMRKYTIKHSEFKEFWDCYNTIMERLYEKHFRS